MDHDSVNINSLPRELLVDVLTRVASSSFTDLFNSKFCCRDFKGAVEEDGIFEQVCIVKIPFIHQWPRSYQVNRFMDRCMGMRNPEALYRQGMVEYFSHGNMQSGLENLRRATEKGHVEAKYVYGILLLCMGGEPSVDGLNLLNTMEKINALTASKSGSFNIFQECREKVKSNFGSMWIRNRVVDQRTNSCRHPMAMVKVFEPWEGRSEVEEGIRCESCKWDGEVRFFCNLMQ